MANGDPSQATTLDPDSEPGATHVDHAVALTIVHHPDLTRLGERALVGAFGGTGSLRLSRLVPRFVSSAAPEGLALGVAHLSRRPIFIETTAAKGVCLTLDADTVSMRADGLACGDSQWLSWSDVERGVVLELSGRVALLLHRVMGARPAVDDQRGLIGASDAMHAVRERIARAAPLAVTVLLRGESGTGKELVAQALHELSPRRARRFVSVNMAAIPAATAAAALFGHARGAFTGAVGTSRGYFGKADGGTLFLDEIGDTPSAIQAALLRAVESGEVQPLGQEDTIRVDARLVAATDADLDQAIADGHFRLALMQRLAGYIIELPPLRKRRDDIPSLLVHFLRRELADLGHAERLTTPPDSERPWLPTWLVAGAIRAPWPGNIRQLKNAARQLAIDWGHVGEVPRDPTVEELFGINTPPPLPQPKRLSRSLEAISEDDMIAALRDNSWQPAATAVALGISRTSLYALMKKSSRVRKAADVTEEEITAALSDSNNDTSRAANALSISEQGLKRQMHHLGITPTRPSST